MFSGSIVALVTPMKGGEVDIENLRQLVEFHIEKGTHSIVAAGTTGESGTLSDEEKKRVISAVVEQVNGRIPVIAGTGSQSTRHTIELTKMAMEQGVDAALIMTPAYIKPTQEGLYLHYAHIAQAVPMPQILYNVPSRTACDMLPETVGRLAGFSNIVGIKEATGKLERINEIKQYTDGKLDLFSGDDPTAKDFMLKGGKGVISVTANVAPQLMVSLCSAALHQKVEEAEAIDSQLAELHKALFLESNPIPVKWALNKMGLIGEDIRLPLTFLSEKHYFSLETAMKKAGCL